MTEQPSLRRLAERLDADASLADTTATCAAVKRTLIEEISSGRFELPAAFSQTCANGYARRLLHKGEGYAVVVMVWGPDQGTPIHDHDNKWCVECVYSGQVRVTSYDLIGEPTDDVVSFREADRIVASKGMAGSLIPPFDYHVIDNPHADTAVTIHVYGGEMFGCHAYAPLADGRYRRERRELTYTAD